MVTCEDERVALIAKRIEDVASWLEKASMGRHKCPGRRKCEELCDMLYDAAHDLREKVPPKPLHPLEYLEETAER